MGRVRKMTVTDDVEAFLSGKYDVLMPTWQLKQLEKLIPNVNTSKVIWDTERQQFKPINKMDRYKNEGT